MNEFLHRKPNIPKNRLNLSSEHIKIIHTIASLKRSRGGPTASVSRMCEELASNGAIVTLLSQNDFKIKEDCQLPDPRRVQTRLVKKVLNLKQRISYSPFFSRTLMAECRRQNIQVIHDHGIWFPSNHATARCACRLRIPLVINPRGMLERRALSHRSLKKRIAWTLYQQHDLSSATLFCATSKKETESIRAAGLQQPIALIPNGIDLPKLEPYYKRIRDIRTALFLSRIHPIKGINNLIKAWKMARPPGWRLIIAGPSEIGYKYKVERIVKKMGLQDCIKIQDAVVGDLKESLYRNSDLFILPSFSESFGMVVAEALSYEIPVITTKGTPWEGLEKFRCGWWIDIGDEPLAKAIREAIAVNDIERHEMGIRGRLYVEREFSWSNIGKQMLSVYKMIIGIGEKPSCIIN